MMEKEQGVDPAQLISKIPLGMRVPGLRDKLVKIISDYTMQLQLRESCNLVLKADCFELLKKLCYQQRRAMRVVADPSELHALRSLSSSKKHDHRRGGTAGSSKSSTITESNAMRSQSGERLSNGRLSIGSEADGAFVDPDAVVVPFSDRIHYPGAMGTEHSHSTRHSGRVSTDFSSIAGGPEAAPPPTPNIYTQ